MVRVIFGCDEESGMECMSHYKKNDRIPDLSFSPDGEYPLTNSEKSIVNAVFERKFHSTITVRAGDVANVVPGEAVAVVPLTIEEVKAVAERFGNNRD
jgi:succinyl-diaminopimelate desuccinylase